MQSLYHHYDHRYQTDTKKVLIAYCKHHTHMT